MKRINPNLPIHKAAGDTIPAIISNRRRVGFLAWFIFIGPGVAEFTHFIFPILKPAILPDVAGTISQAVSNGRFVAGMQNYWVKTTGVYYFPGLYTAILPMIPGIYAIRKVLKASRRLEPRQG
jgi:hypothetical protein